MINYHCVLISTLTPLSSSSVAVKAPVCLNKPAPDATAASEWIDAWFNTTVVNQSLVTDPTISPPDFNLPRHLWSTLNRFRTGQGRCAANLVRWHQASDLSCICGYPDNGSCRQSLSNHTIFLWFMVYGYYMKPTKKLFHG